MEIILSHEVNRRADRRMELRSRAAGFWMLSSPWSSFLGASMCFSWAPPASARAFSPRPLGHAAVRAGHNVRFIHADNFARAMAQARVDNSADRTFRSFLSPDMLILDDFGLHKLTAQQSADLYELIVNRHRASSFIITSNRAVEEWLSLFDDPILGNSALDQLANASFQIVIEGASYRKNSRLTGSAWVTSEAIDPSAET